ncbi:hypothetical protein [Coleofasciculus sp. G2-EDA-02]|uniref:hypothetical protein n=1 Tax=Coleofasciculus sp. G2-EDA-02 TaxID=3069529 RepID=UPI0032F3B7F2
MLRLLAGGEESEVPQLASLLFGASNSSRQGRFYSSSEFPVSSADASKSYLSLVLLRVHRQLPASRRQNILLVRLAFTVCG